MPKVMIIDDAPGIRNSFSRVLRREGFEAIAVGDGLQALGAAGNQPPDLIVLDMNMPHMDGAEVLRRLRANILWKSIPVLVFSGAPSAAKRAGELGVSQILEKGTVTVPQVIDKIREMTAGAGGGRFGPAPVAFA